MRGAAPTRASVRAAPAVHGRRVDARAELVRSGIGHAVSANVTGLLVVVVAVVAGWASAEDPSASWRGAAAVGGALWLVAHLVDVGLGLPLIEGGAGIAAVTLTPLGAAALVAGLHVRAGRRLSKLADAWGAGRGLLLAAVATGAITTGAMAAGVAAWCAGPAVAVGSGPAAAGAGVFAAAAMTIGVAARGGWRLTASVPGPVADHLARCWPAVVVAAASWLVAGAAVVTAALAVRIAGVVEATTALGAGAFGGFWLLVAQVSLLPNAVVWAGGLLGGARVDVGAGTLALSGSDTATFPPLPLLAAVPGPGVWPIWAWAGVLVVVACGVVAGWRAHRQPQRRPVGFAERVGDCLAIGAGAGAVAAALSWAAGGSLAAWGPVGSDPLVVGGAVAVEVAVGALAAVTTLTLTGSRSRRL